ncbi:MAG: hypothetical protein LBH74_09060 [Nitrososphaerota archaeon]|nr:hypothetical protein [Nitrososphaerota archaeon]
MISSTHTHSTTHNPVAIYQTVFCHINSTLIITIVLVGAIIILMLKKCF